LVEEHSVTAFLQLVRQLGPHATRLLQVLSVWDKLPKDLRARLQETATTVLAAHSIEARIRVAEDPAKDLAASATSAENKRLCAVYLHRATNRPQRHASVERVART
jgi:hypothetical protein